MSNYHYSDQSGCKNGCLGKSSYSDLKDTTDYTCDQACLCRFTGERSDKDKLYYNWFVLGQPMKLPTSGAIPPPANNTCKKEN